MFEKYQTEIENQIIDILLKNDIPTLELEWKSIPFEGQWGLSTSFFQTASLESKRLGQKTNIQQRAQEIAELLKNSIQLSESYKRCESVNGYLNVYFRTPHFANLVLEEVLREKEKFGSAINNERLIMIEFSQPNTHKAFHVGHLRNIMVGSAVANILEFAGNKIIRANYLGDIGYHVITWLWNYQKYHKGENPPESEKTKWIGDLYTEAINRRDESKENELEVRELFKLWDQRDKEIVTLWQKTRQWSLDAFEDLYALLGIHFDRVYFESEVEQEGKILIEELIKKNLAQDERPEGAVIINLDHLLNTKDEYRVLVLLRSDGTSLYATKDIPLAIKKFTEYKLDQSIYVIDVRQTLYMKQIFKTLELMGFGWARKCYHLAYEIVNLPGNVTIASREGTVVLLDDLINEATRRARVIVEEKNPDATEEEKRRIAELVAVGAIKYPLLSRDNTKVVTFDWESALDVNGQASPYIQYAAVRANSILRKVGFTIPKNGIIPNELEQQEIELIDMISRFPAIIQRAASAMKPLEIANYAYNLARAFNDFYMCCPVLTSKIEKDFRLRVVAATYQTIKNSLSLLGIEVPQKM